LGIIAEASYQDDTVELQGGERFVFITDGCYEWARTEADTGWEPFIQLMDQHRTTTAIGLWEHLRSHIREHHGNELEDDCTLIILDILP
jgi:serine phosphatase RsbU (regulator of sigma subunit)